MSSAAPTPAKSSAHNALVLSGGGARAAYQVGVLQTIAAIRREQGQAQAPNPFPILCGTSAGAINAALGAAAILALGDVALAKKLDAYRANEGLLGMRWNWEK
jgi:predicted acylesterase/phospholipase RssA